MKGGAMLDFRKLFLITVTLALFASLCMTTAAPTASTLNMPVSGFIGVNDNLIISQCAFDTASDASRPTTKVVQAHDYVTARVSPLTAHFDGEAATDVALGASTRSPSPPQMVLNHNTAKMVEVDVANPASNHRR